MEAQYNLLKLISDRELKHENKLDDEDHVVEDSNSVVTYAFPAFLSSQRFPRNRVKKLLDRSLYQGVSAEVEAEGLFIQLTGDGFPFRQVFLGLTQREFCIIKQEIENFEPVLNDKRDIEIANLVVDQIIPLPVIRFLILDDSSKYFTILTYPGMRYRFQMCQLDSDSDDMWQKWREIILSLSDDPKSTDPNIWKTSYVIALHSGVATRSKVKSAYAKPLGFVAVRNVGIQTTENMIEEITSNDNAINKTSDTGLEKDSDSSSSSEYDFLEKTKIGYKPKDRLAVLFTRSSFASYNDTENIMCPDTEDTMRSDTEDETRPDAGDRIMKPDTKYIMRPDTEDTMRVDTEDIMRPNTENIMRPDPEQIMKHELRKTRSLNDLPDSLCKMLDTPIAEPSTLKKLSKVGDSIRASGNESSSESDNDLDEWTGEAKYTMEHRETARSARDLWSFVRTRVVPRQKSKIIGRFQRIVHLAHFRILSRRDDTLAQSVIELDVMDVSLQLAYMSRKLFLAVTATDLDIFTRSHGKEINGSLETILKFSENIRKMVITEVLKSRSLSGSIHALKFFLQVGLKLLFHLHDFQSLIAIVRGLTSLPLYRLDRIWLTFFIQEPFAFCHFLTLVQFLNPTKQHAAYFARVTTCLRRQKPFIPLLDHILEHCLKCKNEKHGDSHQWQYRDVNIDPMYTKYDSREQSEKSDLRMPTHDTDLQSHKDKQRSNAIPENGTNDMSLPVRLDTQDSTNVEVSPRPVSSRSSNKKKRHSFKQILFDGYLTDLLFGKKPKYHVALKNDSVAQGGLGIEENGEMLSQTNDEKGCRNNLKKSPLLMQYFDNTARNILCSAVKEARELIERDEMSIDSEDDSSVYSGTSSPVYMSDHPGEGLREEKDIEIEFCLQEMPETKFEENSETFKGSDAKSNEIKTERSIKRPPELKLIEVSKSNSDDIKHVKNLLDDADDADNANRKSKAKLSEKGKIQNTNTRKKGFLNLKQIMKKFRKAKKADFKHIKVLQNDIDEIADLMRSFEAFDFEEDEREQAAESSITTETVSEHNDEFTVNTKHVPDMGSPLKTTDFEEVKSTDTVDKNKATEANSGQNVEFKKNSKSVLGGLSRSFETFADEQNGKMPTVATKHVTDMTSMQSDDFKTSIQSLPDWKRSIKHFDDDVQVSQVDKNAAIEKKTKSFSDINNCLKMFDVRKDQYYSNDTLSVHNFKKPSQSLPDMKTSFYNIDAKEDKTQSTVDKNNDTEKVTENKFKTTSKALHHIMNFRKLFSTEELENSATEENNSEDFAVMDNNDGFETNTESVSFRPRRKSYVPEIVAMGRRKSMFEEAIANKFEEEDEASIFEHLKSTKLSELKQKRSAVFDLLSPDEEDLAEDDKKSEPCITGKRTLIESVTNLFGNNNKSNNSSLEITNDEYLANIWCKSVVRLHAKMGITMNREKESIPISGDRCLGNLKLSTGTFQENINQNSLIMLVKSDHDIEYAQTASSHVKSRLGYYDTVVENCPGNGQCSLCSNKACLYESGIWNHILDTQINLLKRRIQSRQRVKHFLDSVFTINNFLTDFDILQLSTQSG
ncbi:uncharacterized protein LOC123535711 [Mercenaria mercenaria]|uniref:uncharacterized protein LOC123535711 n=1 Tax=Mercenaria mercenaria TaxID=6596 RepID=UPI00234E777F|nr:uncharacterized protein LOC123535711 [Mercenaria mercenaria]